MHIQNVMDKVVEDLKEKYEVDELEDKIYQLKISNVEYNVTIKDGKVIHTMPVGV